MSSPRSSEAQVEDTCIAVARIHTVQREVKVTGSAHRYVDLSRNPTRDAYPIHRASA